MKNKLAALALGLGAISFADTTTGQPVQVTTTEQIHFAPGGTIRVNDSKGNLSIDAWDQPDIEFTVIKSLGYDTEPTATATQRLAAVHVTTTPKSDSEVVIGTSYDQPHSRFHNPFSTTRNVTVEYRLRVPRNSKLIIDHADGYISVTGVTGSIEANSRRGDILLMLPDLDKSSIVAHTKFGVVTSDVGGATHNKRSMGEDFRHGDAALSRHLALRMGFGGITIKELPVESVAR